MALRDRGILTRRRIEINGAEPGPEVTVLNGADPSPAPVTQGVSPVEPSLEVDRPRVVLSREATELKHKINDRLVRELDPTRLSSGLNPEEARRAVEDAVADLLAQENASISRADELIIMREIADEIVGYGPIEPLLNDDEITEVMVNAADRVFYEKAGVLHLSDRTFRDDDHVMLLIDKIVSPLGRRIDESSPMVDARLPDGSRVNAIIPPLAIQGPSVTIRKFSKRPYTEEDLIRFGTVTPGMMDLLRACVACKLNVLVSGGTGTGKTTFLNVLSSFISNRERIVSIENPAELQLKQDNWVSLESRPPNVEGRGAVEQRDLVRNALRMRPDRIIVGECRAGEAFDMLQAMNTGHDGSLTTVHANSPRDALARIENMVLMANMDLPAKAIREQIASAINIIIQLTRLPDGSRRVTHMTEIVGMEGEVITMHDIFSFHQHGIDGEGRVIGEILPGGIRPFFADQLERNGYFLPAEIFQTSRGGL
jgi:pilus assembly protein CpaF